MTALYNEITPFAVEWMRNLVAAGHIAPGDVDGRSIKELVAADLAGRAQCHFFAGIGVWSHSLRRAGAVRCVADTAIGGRLQGSAADGRASGQDRTRSADDGGAVLVVHAGSEGSGRDAGAIPRAEREGSRERQLFGRVVNLAEPTGHVGGFWRDAEWVLCRDGKARPIEPGTFPLANGATARMGRLHAYGNAICSPLAVEFAEAVIDILCALY